MNEESKLALLLIAIPFIVAILGGIGMLISFRIWGRDKVLGYLQKKAATSDEKMDRMFRDDHPGRWVP